MFLNAYQFFIYRSFENYLLIFEKFLVWRNEFFTNVSLACGKHRVMIAKNLQSVQGHH